MILGRKYAVTYGFNDSQISGIYIGECDGALSFVIKERNYLTINSKRANSKRTPTKINIPKDKISSYSLIYEEEECESFEMLTDQYVSDMELSKEILIPRELISYLDKEDLKDDLYL